MAWKQVGNTAVDIKKEKGKSFTGTYSGQNEIVTKLGKQTIYQFVDEDGMPFGVYGFTTLNMAMKNIPMDTKCRLTYQGTKNVDTKFGKDKPVHQVLVEIYSEEHEEAEVPF